MLNIIKSIVAKKMIVALVFIVSTIFLINAGFSEMRVTTQDGRNFTVPVNSKDIKFIEFVGTQASSRIDPTGTWRNNPQATWTFTMGADGRYFAQETGLGNAKGPAYFMPSGSFRIDYKTGAYTGYFEMRFASDGRTASGSFHQLTPTQRSENDINWTRLK
jgi:hypothetical protein